MLQHPTDVILKKATLIHYKNLIPGTFSPQNWHELPWLEGREQDWFEYWKVKLVPLDEKEMVKDLHSVFHFFFKIITGNFVFFSIISGVLRRHKILKWGENQRLNSVLFGHSKFWFFPARSNKGGSTLKPWILLLNIIYVLIICIRRERTEKYQRTGRFLDKNLKHDFHRKTIFWQIWIIIWETKLTQVLRISLFHLKHAFQAYKTKIC